MATVDKEMKRLEAHKKTQLCKFFEVGACTRGSRCTFAHGQEQLRRQPDFSKTRLCADFMQMGRCSEGARCAFAHGRRELKPGSAAKVGRPREKAKAEKPEKVAAVSHEQAALILMMQAVKPNKLKSKEDLDSEPDFDLNGIQSFSRQTTWEGEMGESSFSRGSSMESEFIELAELQLPAEPVGSECEVELQIKNTFLEFCVVSSLPRTRSLPLF